MGRHTVPGTGKPSPDRGFWVRLAAVVVAVVLVAYRIGVPPIEDLASTDEDTLSRGFGLWLSLGGATGVALAGWKAMQAGGTSIAAEWGRLRDRMGSGRPPRAHGA